MRKPSDVRKYFYWSQRRVGQIAEDNGILTAAYGSTKYKSPAIPFAPQIEVDVPRKQLTRHDIASRIEHHLKGVTTTDFLSDSPTRFAKGCGTILFSEYVNFGKRADIVSIFTETRSPGGRRIAICMFGSRDNLADVIATSPTVDRGWTSSAAGEIFDFIMSKGRKIDWREDSEYIATEAVNLARNQGGTLDEPGRKGFTYGHISGVGEWMVEVYLDVKQPRSESYDRIIVGAPLWVRTPSPQSLVLYGRLTEDDRASLEPLFDPEGMSWLSRWLRWWPFGFHNPRLTRSR